MKIYSKHPTQIDLYSFGKSDGSLGLPPGSGIDLFFFLANQHKVTSKIPLPNTKESLTKLGILISGDGQYEKSRLWVCERTPWFTICGPVREIDLEDLVVTVEFKKGDIIPNDPLPLKTDEMPHALEDYVSCLTVTAAITEYARLKENVQFDSENVVFSKSDDGKWEKTSVGVIFS